MTARLLDMVWVETATQGTGTLTLGSAVSKTFSRFLTFAEADGVDGASYAYFIQDGVGWERGVGVWDETANTLTRTVSKSLSRTDGTVSTSALDLSGRATVAVSLRAIDYATLADLQDSLATQTALATAAAASATTASAAATAAAASAAAVNPALFLTKAGGSTGGAMTGPLNFKRSTVASHATTADIWSAGNQIDWTGTATVTNFPAAPQAGAERDLICAGACTFTHNANITVEGGATFTAAANDVVTIRAITTSTFHATIKRASGRAVVYDIPGVRLLATLTASSSASLVDTTSLTSAYDAYLIEFANITPATDSVSFRLRVSTDGGSNYLATGYDNEGGAIATYISLGETVKNTVATGGVDGIAKLSNPNSTTVDKWVSGLLKVSKGAGLGSFAVAGGYIAAQTAINALQFTMSSGNIASGKIRIYGVTTS